VDWNSDGKRDLVTGDRNGYFNVFIQTDTGLIAYYQMRLIDNTILDVGYNSQPAVTDWDWDGKKDLILGEQNGYVRLYLNQTTDTWPMFQNYTYIQSGGSSINLYRVNPYVVDLDRDGKRDLVCGANDGYLHFYRNVGSDTNPTFAGEEYLLTTNGTPIRPSGNYAGSRVGFGDWNNDGGLDFLISGFDGYVELYLGEGVGVKERSKIALTPNNFTICPNPARSLININYNLSRSTDGSLRIFDISGREVALLESGKLAEGNHSLEWYPKVQAGIYLCKLNFGYKSFTRKFVITE
jgi:hypothetical protein